MWSSSWFEDRRERPHPKASSCYSRSLLQRIRSHPTELLRLLEDGRVGRWADDTMNRPVSFRQSRGQSKSVKQQHDSSVVCTFAPVGITGASRRECCTLSGLLVSNG